jgi:ATP-binding cassette subfamily B protein
MRTGDILARATNDMNAVRMMLGPGVMYWCETSLTLVLAVSVMLFVDWPLTLIALAPAPLVTVAVLSSDGTFTIVSKPSRRCSPTSAAACRRASPVCA